MHICIDKLWIVIIAFKISRVSEPGLLFDNKITDFDSDITVTSHDFSIDSNRWQVDCFVQQLVHSNNRINHQRCEQLSLCQGNPPITDGFPSQITIARTQKYVHCCNFLAYVIHMGDFMTCFVRNNEIRLWNQINQWIIRGIDNGLKEAPGQCMRQCWLGSPTNQYIAWCHAVSNNNMVLVYEDFVARGRYLRHE